MKQYYEQNRQDRKLMYMVSDYNAKVGPAQRKAKQIADAFELDGITEKRIKNILGNYPGLALEIPKNIESVMESMISYGYDVADVKDLIRSHIDILTQSNLGLTTKLQSLRNCSLEERALIKSQNLLYRSAVINEKAIAVINECLEAYGLNEDEICNYFSSHVNMLGQNSIELRRTFAILHHHNLLEKALFEDSRILSVKSDASLMYAMIESIHNSDMPVNPANLYTYYKATSANGKDSLKRAYPFGLKQKMVVDYFYNNFTSQDKDVVVKERK